MSLETRVKKLETELNPGVVYRIVFVGWGDTASEASGCQAKRRARRCRSSSAWFNGTEEHPVPLGRTYSWQRSP
jgi:hypothetical protein